VSEIANEEAAERVEIVEGSPARAVELALTVQTVELVCSIDVIAEMPVKVKSTPDSVESEEQSIASSPVTVKLIAVELEVPPTSSSVTTGPVVSMVTLDALAAAEGPLFDAPS
jgi:hypothetical protein